MTLVLITGVAGFIGSHLAEALRSTGAQVRGVDCFTPYYDRSAKEANLASLREDSGFELIDADLSSTDLAPLVDGVDVVFHQAAQAGVRSSWSTSFVDYDRSNILATQRLLDAVVDHDLQRFVYASSSSVYGNSPSFPCFEDQLPSPHSPYGLTKLAGELLCGLYASNYGIPTTSLRYFTVYGPRQRPDMAFHRLFEAALRGTTFPMYGDGTAIRDFTFVADIVRANLLAAGSDAKPGAVVNVSGGVSTSLAEVIMTIEGLTGAPLPIEKRPMQEGDVIRTGGSNERARRMLGWAPEVSLVDGLEAQLAWHRAR